MTASAARARTDWPAVAAVVGAGVVAALQVGKAVIAVPLLQAEFGLDLAALGWLMAIFAILGMLGGIPAGALAAGFGDRRVLILGLLAIAAGASLGAAAPRFAMLLASRVLEGLGFLLVVVAGPAILQRVASAQRRDITIALWSCFMPAGMALAMLAGLWLADWRVIWHAMAALAVIAMALSWLVIPPVPAIGASLSWGALVVDAGAALRTHGAPLLALCFALYTLMFFALFSFLPVLLMQRMQVSFVAAGLLSALAAAANIVGNLAAGWLLARGVARPALIIGASLVMGLCGLGIFLPLLSNDATFLLCLLFSLVGGLVPATLLSSATLLAPRAGLTAVVVGLAMQGSNLGQVVGPVAVGGVIEAFGWPAASALVAGAALLAILTALGLRGAFGTAR